MESNNHNENFIEDVQHGSRIKGVKPTIYNGVRYRSKLEAKTAEILDALHIKYNYEKITFTLQERFKYRGKTYRPIEYIPDFVIDKIMIECKGYATPEWKIKKKLILHHLLESEEYEFWEIHNEKELLEKMDISNINIHAVDVFTLKGDFVGNYPCVRDAVESLNLKSRCNITSCLCGYRKSAQGLVWKYHPTEVPFLENEEWKPIVGFEDLYLVSNKGRVASIQYHGKAAFSLMKQTDVKGYKLVKIRNSKTGFNQSLKVHVLVAKAFIPNPENKPYIDHIDTDPGNNNVENLRWVTHLENQRNPITLTRLKENMLSMNQAKIGITASAKARSIKVKHVENGVETLYDCAASAGKETGHTTSTILKWSKTNKNGWSLA